MAPEPVHNLAPYYVPPEAAPRAATARPSGGVMAAVVVAVVAVIAAAIALMTSGHDDAPSESAAGASASAPEAVAGGASERSRPAGRPRLGPPLVFGADGSASPVSCPDGYQLSDRSGEFSRAGRGSDTTSCQFARNVGEAFWGMSVAASEFNRTVVAAGAVPCSPGVARCQGSDFVMDVHAWRDGRLDHLPRRQQCGGLPVLALNCGTGGRTRLITPQRATRPGPE